jgi:hypothetical protein
MCSVFISHSNQDKEFVEQLARDLDNRGISVWFDKWELKVGDSLRRKISEGIHESSYFIVVVSQASKNSKWVAQELDEAFARQVEHDGNFILPVVLDKSAIPSMLSGLLYADFSMDYEHGLNALLRLFLGRSYYHDAEKGSDKGMVNPGFFFLRHEEYVTIQISSVWDGIVEFVDAARAALRVARKQSLDVVGRVGASLLKYGAGLGMTTINTEAGIRVVGEHWSIDGRWELGNEDPAVHYNVTLRIDRTSDFLQDSRTCPLLVPSRLNVAEWTEMGIEFPCATTVEDVVSRFPESLFSLTKLIPGTAGEIVFRSSFDPKQKKSNVDINRWVDLTILLGAGRVTVKVKPTWKIRDELESHIRKIWKAVRNILDPENKLS